MLYYLCLEAFATSSKATLDDLHAQKQILNRYIIGQVILTDNVIDSIRRFMRKLYPDVKVESDELFAIINNEVFKREIVERDSAVDAKRTVQRLTKKLQIKAPTKSAKEPISTED